MWCNVDYLAQKAVLTALDKGGNGDEDQLTFASAMRDKELETLLATN